MADNLKNSGPQDGWRINIHQEHELDYWTKALHVSRADLRAIVAQVGTYAADVRAHIVATKGDGHDDSVRDNGPAAGAVDASDPALSDDDGA
jgi:hypothetical protein